MIYQQLLVHLQLEVVYGIKNVVVQNVFSVYWRKLVHLMMVVVKSLHVDRKMVMKGNNKKRKGETCGKPSHGRFCDKHMYRASNSPPAPRCVALLASGARKGEPCGAKGASCTMADGTEKVLCKRHNKMLMKQA